MLRPSGTCSGTNKGLEARVRHSAAEVKEAFRQAALRWHPDRLKHASQAEVARARSRFHQVTEAYNVLKDPELRRNYDRGA